MSTKNCAKKTLPTKDKVLSKAMLYAETCKKEFTRLLLRWFHANARELPWRRDQSPYRVWISEVMLQQTQVGTVIPYYEKWMKRYPTLESLSRASESDVLRLWQGLGYYHRAKNVLNAAKQLQKEHRGDFPHEYDQIRKMKGIGDYTAGAISSLAFGAKRSVVDGNVERVLVRFFGIESDLIWLRKRRIIWHLADGLLPEDKVGTFNEALMELGATVCHRQKPACMQCPFFRGFANKSLCLAAKYQKVDELPKRAKRSATIKRHKVALVIMKGEQCLILKRQNTTLMEGLWEFPTLDKPSDNHVLQAFKKHYGEALDGGADTLEFLFQVRHAYTKYRIVMDVYRLLLSGCLPQVSVPIHKWVPPKAMKSYPFTAGASRIIRRLEGMQE